MFCAQISHRKNELESLDVWKVVFAWPWMRCSICFVILSRVLLTSSITKKELFGKVSSVSAAKISLDRRSTAVIVGNSAALERDAYASCSRIPLARVPSLNVEPPPRLSSQKKCPPGSWSGGIPSYLFPSTNALLCVRLDTKIFFSSVNEPHSYFKKQQKSFWM